MPADPKWGGGAGGDGRYPWAGGQAPADLLALASSVLAREAVRVAQTAGTPSGLPAPGTTGAPLPMAGDLASLAGRICPVTGAALPLPGADKDVLRRQGHDLLGSLQGLLAQPTGGFGGIPLAGLDRDRIRRQAHELIETLLITFSEATDETGLPADDRVPLLSCAAPVPAGGAARATLRVANDEATPSTVTLYTTNFVADCGYEIPALRVSTSPRMATIPAKSEGLFEITIAVPPQTPAGIYSGLIQAMGSKYLKSVLMVEVS